MGHILCICVEEKVKKGLFMVLLVKEESLEEHW